MVTRPSVPDVLTDATWMGSFSGSESFARTSMTTALFLFVDAVSSAADGARLTDWYPSNSVDGEVRVELAPIWTTTVNDEPCVEVMRAPVQFARTTLDALFAAIESEPNVPELWRKVPPSDDWAATGVRATVAWFFPQTTMVRVLPAVAALFDGGHALPGVEGPPATTASRTSNV